MVGIIMNFLFVMRDLTSELISPKKMYVTSTSEFKKALLDLKIKPEDVRMYGSKEPISDWTKVLGVIKTENGLYAYSDINSEINAKVDLL